MIPFLPILTSHLLSLLSAFLSLHILHLPPAILYAIPLLRIMSSSRTTILLAHLSALLQFLTFQIPFAALFEMSTYIASPDSFNFVHPLLHSPSLYGKGLYDHNPLTTPNHLLYLVFNFFYIIYTSSFWLV